MKSLLQTLKKHFLRLTIREKSLFLLFMIVMLAIWLNAQLGQFTATQTLRQSIERDLAEQKLWLDRAESIQQSLAEALALVDPSRTYSASQLTGRIDNLARASRLTADIDPVATREGQIFNNHRVRVRLNRLTPEALLTFTQRLHSESPYITLDRLRLTPNRASVETLDAQFEISSFELKQTPDI
jgi:hypothetical protein